MPNISSDAVRPILNFYYQNFKDDVAISTDVDLTGSHLGDSNPLEIFDLDGSKLFRDFEILHRNGSKIGVVRSSARGTELPPIDSIMIGKLMFDPPVASAAILQKAALDYPGGSFEAAGFVCYGYPRIGLRVRAKHQGRNFDVVYDAHLVQKVTEIVNARIVKANGDEAGLEAGNPIEGEPFYSYSSKIPEAGSGDNFASDWTNIIELVRSLDSRLPLIEKRSLLPSAAFEAAEIALSARSRAEESSPTMKPAISGTSLPIPLIGQETKVYCAVATGKMMLDYLGFGTLTQTQIAEAFMTTEKGTTNPNMMSGLARLSNNRLSGDLLNAPTFEQSGAQFRNFLPAKSGIPGHARLLRGWREYTYLNRASGTVAFTNSFYVVNDPYPTGHGQYVLECAKKPIDDFYRNLLTVKIGA